MECDICHRPGGPVLPINCDLCARDAIYQPRLALVQALIENEGLEKDVEQRISLRKPQKSSFLASKAQQNDTAWELQRSQSDTFVANSRREETLSHVKALRQEIQHMKLDMARRKAHMARRRKDLASARHQLSASQKDGIEPVQAEVEGLSKRMGELHLKTAETAISRNSFTAWLLGLQQLRLKGSPTPKHAIYFLGSNRVWNLKELNHADPRKLSAVLLTIADITLQAARNLSLRLPAEIILPTSQYAHTAIISPNVSYTSRHPLLPGFGSAQAHRKGGDKAGESDKNQPRARPLFLDKKLSVLAKDDGPLYSRHVEGITLLAWNIAWLCRTQGLDVGSQSWEDVLNMGPNLYELLLGPGTGPAKAAPSGNDQEGRLPLKLPSKDNKDNAARGPPPRAYFSHASRHGFLNSAEGAEYMRDWKLADPIKAINRVKAMLQAERMGAEWEILDDREWREQEQEEQRALAARSPAGDTKVGTFLEQTGVLVKPGVGGDLVARKEQEVERGKNLKMWTKLTGL